MPSSTDTYLLCYLVVVEEVHGGVPDGHGDGKGEKHKPDEPCLEVARRVVLLHLLLLV